MKRLRIIIMLLLFSNLTIKAQLNPIKNLYFQVISYEFGNSNCPQFNCNNFTWERPDTSFTDTLIGYNIYKDNIFYKFTIDTNASCPGYCPCSYLDFYDNLPFWLSVKAVYNSDSITSIAEDSIFIDNFVTNIKEIKKNKILLIKNPVKLGDNISILFSNIKSNKGIIQIISQKGEIIKEYSIENTFNNIVNISTNKLSHGIYYINFISKENNLSTKLMIE